MNLLDLTLPSPAENLACDEALLDACEAGGPEVLRFWEARNHFVVVGYGNHAATEVEVEACRREGVPILRRCSGGGTVVQGPGCLNYAVVLRIESNPAWQTIPGANRAIMERNRAALESLLGRSVRVRGFTDLALGELKFSGNAQRRHRQALLFHGTFLLDFDLGLIQRLLPMPSKQPDYRLDRAHEQFVTNLKVPAAEVKRALSGAWGGTASLSEPPDFGGLLAEKYNRTEWNMR